MAECDTDSEYECIGPASKKKKNSEITCIASCSKEQHFHINTTQSTDNDSQRMLVNKYTTVIGEDIMLIPYRKEHVEKYHNWMKSEELQHLTASQPLSLEEEYEMQESWMRDENKCTFIVLDKHIYEKNRNEIEAMIGDTNLFFANDIDRMVAEAEIMIAEPDARGRHLGWQAMLLMLLYGIMHLQVQQYVVKISVDNHVSIKMFEKMRFIETSRSEVFQEVTLNKVVDDDWIKWLNDNVGAFQLIKENVF